MKKHNRYLFVYILVAVLFAFALTAYGATVVSLGKNGTSEYLLYPTDTLSAHYFIGTSTTAINLFPRLTSTDATTTTFAVTGLGTSTFAGSILLQNNGHLTVHGILADGSDGLHMNAGNGTEVVNLGAGNSANALFYGGVNINGATRLATSLNGLAFLTNGAVSGIATNTLNLTVSSFASPNVSQWTNDAGYEAGLTAGDGLTRTVNDFDCDTANTSTFGCLSDTDWDTFNNKQASLGSGTAGQILAWLGGTPTWTATTTFSSGLTYLNGNVTNTITAGDALTRTGDDIDFDGGATPSGDLGGTWASPSVTDDSHNHTSTTISGLDISADTNLSADGTEIVLTGDALSLGTSLTFTQATTTNFAVSSITSALMQTNGNGTVEEYGGTTCTNQLVRSLSALGVATCATVQTTDVASGIALDSELPTGSNPSATIGLTANNGVATTFMRSDATPALGVGITPTWTGLHIFSTGGLIANASSTIQNLYSTNASTTNLIVSSAGGSAGCATFSVGGTLSNTGVACGSGGGGGGDSKFSTSTINPLAIYMNAGDSLGLGTTTNRSALSMLALATTTGNHLTLRNGNTTWFQKVNDTGSYFFGTTSSTYATATHSALIVPATGGLIVQGSGSSTLRNGITIESGCYSVNGTCIGSGGTLTGSNASAGRVGFWSSANNIDGDADFSWDGALNKLFALKSAFLTSLEIATGTAPTVDRVGMIAFDTTDNQLLMGTTTNSAVETAVYPSRMKLWGATVASTSLEMVNGGRLWLPPQRDGFTVTEIHCAVDAGTSVVINLSNSGGTTDSDTVTCDADGAVDTAMSTNYLYTAGSLNSLEVGVVSGAVDYLTFSIWGTYIRE